MAETTKSVQDSSTASIDMSEGFERIAKLILDIEKALDNDKPTKRLVNKAERLLSEVDESDNLSLEKYAYIIFELRAFVCLADGKTEEGGDELIDACAYKPSDMRFVSKTANDWEQDEIRQQTQDINDRLLAIRSRKQLITRWVFGAVLVILVVGAVLWGRISDYITISSANPTMVQLAEAAGMSKRGEVLFLRTHPVLETGAQFEQDCSTTTSNNNGEEVLGCYEPSTNRIYISSMPSDLYNEEVATAAYETLHPIYISLDKTDSANLNSAIESAFSTDATDSSDCDSDIAPLIKTFATTEPGARDNELFSLLGTSCGTLPDNLANFYTPYFTNIDLAVASDQAVNNLFQNDQNQLTQLNNTINQDYSDANTAYTDSVDWANDGNQYEDNYNYNIYTQDFNAAQTAVNQYNQIVGQYNSLNNALTGGQPINEIQSQQEQGSE